MNSKTNRSSKRRKLFISGLLLFICSILMLFVGVGMFTSRGDYSEFTIHLSEFCFIFWLPFLMIAIVLLLISLFLSETQQETE